VNLPALPSGHSAVVPIGLVLAAAWAGTGMMHRLGVRYGWVAPPRADRWHSAPRALHGGAGFYLPFLAGATWILAQRVDVGRSASPWLTAPPELVLAAAAVLGSALMFGLGLWDDVTPLRPVTKLTGQVVAASLFIFAGGTFPITGMNAVDVALTYLWFAGITNAVNMLDNMDGLAAGIGILAAATLVVLAMAASAGGGRLGPWLGLILVASLGGFWLHNRPPASIFMGDSGSLFVGYVLAALAVPTPLNGFLGLDVAPGTVGATLVLVVPATVLAVPIFDTTLVTFTRKWRAQNATQGGRDHSSHRLVVLGFSEWAAVGSLYVLAAMGGVIALLMPGRPGVGWPLLGSFVVLLLLGGAYLGKASVASAEARRPPPRWTPLVSELLYKRAGAIVMLDTMLIIVCFYAAYALRFDGEVPWGMLASVRQGLPVVVAACLLVNFCVSIYRDSWGLMGMTELPRLAGSALGGALASIAAVTLLTRFGTGHSRSAYIIFGFLYFLALVGTRLSFQTLDTMLGMRRRSRGGEPSRPAALIYGAGPAGKHLYGELTFNPMLEPHTVLGFVDDDPYKMRTRLCGLPVRNGDEWLRCHRHTPVDIWVSSAAIPDEPVLLFASRWSGPAAVRRLRVDVVDVGRPGSTTAAIGTVPAVTSADGVAAGTRATTRAPAAGGASGRRAS
jgi:UDP-GlcNAc:undecaprenyl-phosphate GlcNAc-1-phosphate transferase